MVFQIGHIPIADPVFLAPMSGISDLPFRRLVKRYGAGLVFSEMIASRAMIEQVRGSCKMSESFEEEFPIAVQLAGCDPEVMADAARICADRGASIIDINFGCPVKKIVKKYAGSALMQDEELATAIMEAVVRAVDVPVSVKMRLGWDQDHLNAPSLAKRAQDVGVQMITVHGRTRDQMYNGNADWHAVRAVKEAIDLPLVVNGDILSPEDAITAMEHSSADGVMIGRGAQERPWLLQQVMDYLRHGQIGAEPDARAVCALVLEHYDAILDYYGERKGMAIARKHLASYSTGHDGGAAFRQDINEMRDAAAVRDRIADFFSSCEEEVKAA